MSDKMLEQVEEAVTEDALLLAQEDPEALENVIETLRASIAYLEEKETLLAEKLCMAKEKGLTLQAEKCRGLLQKVILQKREKKEELQEAEAAKLAAELDALTDELAQEFDPNPFEEEEEIEYNYRAKSKRLGLISRMIGFIGVFACMVGALVYSMLAQVETLNIPFEWMYVAITGVAAVIFVIIALLVGGSANKYERMADEKEAEIEEAERALLLKQEQELLAVTRLNAMNEAYSVEMKKDTEYNTPAKASIKDKLLSKVQVPEKVKKNVHKIAPVAAVATAAVAAIAISSSAKKSAEAKRVAAVRKEFFKWLS